MFRALILAMVLVMASSALGADTTVIGRFTGRGSQDLGVCTEIGEIWGFCLDQRYPTIEVGKVVPVGEAYLGGYLSYWSGPRQYYAEPFGVYSRTAGNLRFKVAGFVYLPLNGGKVALGSDEVSLNYKIAKGVSLGALIHFWQTEGEEALEASGLQIEWSPDSKTSLTLRATHGTLGQIRLAVSQSF